MTQEEWVLRDVKKKRARGEDIEKNEIEAERRDKGKSEKSVGESAAFQSSPVCLFPLFHFTAIIE